MRKISAKELTIRLPKEFSLWEDEDFLVLFFYHEEIARFTKGTHPSRVCEAVEKFLEPEK